MSRRRAKKQIVGFGVLDHGDQKLVQFPLSKQDAVALWVRLLLGHSGENLERKLSIVKLERA